MATQTKLDTVLPGSQGDEKVASAGSTEKSQLQYDLNEEEIAALEQAKQVASEDEAASVSPIRPREPRKRAKASASVFEETASTPSGYQESLNQLKLVGRSVVSINDAFDRAKHQLSKRGLNNAARLGEVLKKTALTVPALLIMGHNRWLQRKNH